MSIIQISKIQQRSGNLVDLPQLDEAEFGWATDQKRLFIGKTTPNENVEVITSYSHISFSQIDGSVGNLNITPVTVADGQVLAFDGTNWVNRGGDAGGLITLGDASNVKITGGAIGYVLETDGTGNLSWTPKGTIVSSILTVSKANPGVVTTVENTLLTDGLKINITGAKGMTELNGNIYYVKRDPATQNTLKLYSDAGLTTPVDTTGYTAYAYTNVSNTVATTNIIRVGNTASFTVNYPVQFVGDLTGTNLTANSVYYVKTIANATALTVSASLLANGVAGNAVVLNTVNGLTANVYETGGLVLCSLNSSGGSSTAAAGANTSVQYNTNGITGGGADLTFDYVGKKLTVNGTANVVDLNASGNVAASKFVSNIATGTAPLQVTSTTRVANLNVSYSNVSDFGAVTAGSSGVFYPTFVNGSTTANYALTSNAAFSANLATGVLTVGGLTTLGNISANNITISNIANIGANLNVTGNITASRVISNIATGTAPFTVASTTRVANLNVAYANVSDFTVVTTQSTGIFYPTFVSGSTSANYASASNTAFSANLANGALIATTFVGALSGTATSATNAAAVLNNVQTSGTYYPTFISSTANGNYSVVSNTSYTVNLATGAFNATLLGGTLTTAAQPNITSVGTLSTLSVSGNANVGNLGTTGTILASIANISGNANIGGNLSVSANSTFSGTVTLGAISNVKITGGTSGYVVTTDGSGNLSFSNPSSIGIQAAGSNTQVQFNDAGSLGASSNFVFNTATNRLTVTGNITATQRLTGNDLAITTDGNISGNISVGLSANVSGALNVNGASALKNGVVVTGNASASNVIANAGGAFYGSGAGLTNIPGANVSGAVPFATTANSVAGANVSGTVSSATNATTASTANSVAWANVTGAPTNLSQFTNGPGYITTPVPAGTAMLFAQTSAPTGWTKVTTNNDAALRVVSGSASSGGTVNFSSAFTSQAVSGTVGGTALTVDQLPSHNHSGTLGISYGGGWPGILGFEEGRGSPDWQAGSVGNTGSGQTHTHTFSGTSINLDVKYVDVIIATKN